MILSDQTCSLCIAAAFGVDIGIDLKSRGFSTPMPIATSIVSYGTLLSILKQLTNRLPYLIYVYRDNNRKNIGTVDVIS